MKRTGTIALVMLIGIGGAIATGGGGAVAAAPTRHNTCTFRGRLDVRYPLNNQNSLRNFRPVGTLSGCSDPGYPSATVSGVTDQPTRLTCPQLFYEKSVTTTGKLKIDWQTADGATVRTRARITLHLAQGKVGPLDITGKVDLGPFKGSSVALHSPVRQLLYKVVPTGLHSRGRPFGTCDTLEARNLDSFLLTDTTLVIT